MLLVLIWDFFLRPPYTVCWLHGCSIVWQWGSASFPLCSSTHFWGCNIFSLEVASIIAFQSMCLSSSFSLPHQPCPFVGKPPLYIPSLANPLLVTTWKKHNASWYSDGSTSFATSHWAAIREGKRRESITSPRSLPFLPFPCVILLQHFNPAP